MTETESRQFEALLEMLKQNRGFDFTGYKRSTLMRRVRKRMAAVDIDDFTAYTDYLEVHPDEFRELFNTILINVTAFLRDPEAWQALREQVLPVLASRPEDQPIRVWSAGCASGEETYTLIMELCEALGIERFKKSVKVYATDADGDALNQARHAIYEPRDLESLPAEWRERYFEPGTDGLVFRNDLRRCVIFGEHDLVQDAPISKLDLLVCRNTLIYFNAETQTRILARFHFALNDDGFLFLGRSEMLLTHSRLFAPADVRSRIFTKVSRVNLRDRLLVLAQAGSDEAGGTLGQQIHLREASFDAGSVAQVVVDRTGIMVMANELARQLFHLTQRDLGRPIQDLELSYRPIEIRSRIDEVYTNRKIVLLNDVQHELHGEIRHYDIQIAPLADNGREPLGVSISYIDVSIHHRLRTDLERSRNDLETAYEELQATNEELETTNEELQSTIEELETTNEELQSTNEELETMNEELQSTNEELETINEELRRRTQDLNSVNEFLEAIMTSLRTGVAVLDSRINVTLWNLRAEDLWGLRREEVEGKPFLSLDIGLPLDALAKPIRACLDGKGDFQEVIVDAVNRRGRSIRCRVTCTRLATPLNEPRGLILLMEEWGDSRAA